jgi:hypothetical protein
VNSSHVGNEVELSDSIVLALCTVESNVSSVALTAAAADPLSTVTTSLIRVPEPDGVKLSMTEDAGTPSDAAMEAASAARDVAFKEDTLPDSSIELSTLSPLPLPMVRGDSSTDFTTTVVP